MAQENDQDPNLIKLEDFKGEVEEHWQDARGRKVLDRYGDEVGAVEELYVWEKPSTVHPSKVFGSEYPVLIPVHAVTTVSEQGIEVEESKR